MEAMEAILTAVGAVFTQSVTWIGDVLNIIATEPVTQLLVIGLGVVGFGFGLTKRLISM